MAKATQPTLLGRERGKPQGKAGKWRSPPGRDLCPPPHPDPLPCHWHGAVGWVSPPGQGSMVRGMLASPEERTWPYLEQVRTGLPGPCKVLHHCVHRNKVLGVSTGQGQSHPPAFGTKRLLMAWHSCRAAGRETPGKNQRTRALDGIQQLHAKCLDRADP